MEWTTIAISYFAGSCASVILAIFMTIVASDDSYTHSVWEDNQVQAILVTSIIGGPLVAAMMTLAAISIAFVCVIGSLIEKIKFHIRERSHESS
jgi:hypothetical protein